MSCCYQSPLRENYSTYTCLSQLTDMILNGSKNGKHTGMISIDVQLTCSFDNADHKILIKWFYTYLTQLFWFHDAFLGSGDHKLQSFPAIYIRNFVAFLLNINDIPHTLPNSHTKYMQMIQISFMNISILQISKKL